MRPARAPPDSFAALACAAAAALALAGCQDTLVDHAADPTLLAGPCAVGEAVCGGACVPEDAAHCGPTCADCAAGTPPDPNAAPACGAAHRCAFECRPGYLRSGTSCVRALAVSAGFAHTCALAADGTVKCWGANDHGQLGDGTGKDSAVPVEAALPAPATALGAGFVHTCAVAGGAVYCWGDNTTGALGDGTTAPRLAPVGVQGLAGATAVAAGGGENAGLVVNYYGHSCALASGAVSCWGGNESGQLGDGTFERRTAPVEVVGLGAGASALAAGDRHTCALVAGAVHCWGADGASQLGDGASANSPRPRLAIASGAVAVAAGAAHSCAVLSPPALACWGDDSEGQANAGVSSPAVVATPAAVPLPAAARPAAAAAGRAHTCALTPGVANGVACFGADDASQLGGPATARGLFSVSVAPAQGVAAGWDHTCALLADGGVQCWGANDRGQLGTGAAGAAVAAPAYVSGR